MDTMATWFGLKEPRTDFYVQNESDAEWLFARTDLQGRLKSILIRSARTGNPPKMVLYGDWGVGKTHTMRHMQYEVETKPEYGGVEVVFVELPDILRSTTFQAAHSALLDALGFERVKLWVQQFVAQNADAMDQIKAWTQSSDISKAFTTLIGFGDGARIAWDWLRGMTLPAGDTKSVGLPSTMTQSAQMVHVLRALGRLAKAIDNKMLVLMLDETTKLTNVSGDPVAHWMNAFKLLASDDMKDVGVIVSISLPSIDDFPDPLRDQQVQTRFGEDRYIELRNFDEEDAKDFTRKLLTNCIDAAKMQALLQAHGSESDGESIGDAFPFTDEGFSRFVAHVARTGITSPREIQKYLDDFLNRAMDADRHILSSDFIDELIQAP